MSGWDDAQQTVNDADADAPRTFVRLKDQGDKVVGAFCGEPLVRRVHWSERNQRYAECDGDKCGARANDTKTKYAVLSDAQIAAKLTAEIANADLHDLKAVVTGKQPPREAEEGGDEAAGGLVDADTAAALVGRIKALPDPAVAIETFRKKFGVKKAIELKADQAAAVDAWLRTEENANGADDI